ncbi:MAG: T9SS type A sorting domain-containing protein [bacterium]
MKFKIFVFTILLIGVSIIAFSAPRVIADQALSRPTGPVYNPHRAGVLFVEDPAGGYGPATKPDPKWIEVLDSVLGVGNYSWFGPTGSQPEDGPSLDTMLNYDLVIWNTYDHWNTIVLTDNDTANIADYLDQGGKVWLIGQDLLYSGVPLAWVSANFLLQTVYEDYIPAGAVTINLAGINEFAGIAFSTTSDFDLNDFYPDGLTPGAGAHGVIEDADSSYIVGIVTDDSTASFWTVDGRTTVPYAQWQAMVEGMFNIFGVMAAVEENPGIMPTQFSITELNNISPNPQISLALPVNTEVTIELYDLSGRLQSTVFNGQFSGQRVFDLNLNSSGSYIYKVIADGSTYSGRIVVVK